ncbi:MAG: flagellar biosynthetic protein FliO [Immundisolibacteraceae bacterium]|nr:flagellar biosynthetic protein FliO [Immundisolibacteraceae bacterium]
MRLMLMMGFLLASHGVISAPGDSLETATDEFFSAQADGGIISQSDANSEANLNQDHQSASGAGLDSGIGPGIGPGIGSGLDSGIGPAQHYLLQSMLILGGLLVLLMGSLKLLRKSGHLKTQSGQRLKIVEAVSLGGSDRAVLVRVGNEELLLGVSPGRVAPLMLVDPKSIDAGTSSSLIGADQTDANLDNADQIARVGTGFSQLLSRLRS